MGRKRKSRREYGTGTVTANRRLGRYVARWYDNGTPRSCSKFPLTPEGKAAAESYLAEQNEAAARPRDTLGDWLVEALRASKMRNRASTVRANKYASFIIDEKGPELMNTAIGDLIPADIMAFYRDLQKDHRRNTIRLVHVMIRAAFKLAKANGVTERDIMSDVAVPRDAQKEPLEIFTWREMGHIFRFFKRKKQARSQRWYLFFRLLYVLGCRVGELQALRWTDIDWDRRDVHIQRTVSGPNNQAVMPPKTPSGDRFVPILSDHTFSLLKRAYDNAKDPNGYVFSTRGSGNPVLYATIYKNWMACGTSCGISKTIHCFRHTRASHLIAAGLPIPDVSRMLGHASPAVTMSIYTHALPRYTDNLRKSYQSIVSGKKH